MCCSYCFHFTECKRTKRTDPGCCSDCAEYEFCPFVLGETAAKDVDSPYTEEESDIDILEGDGF